MTRRGVWTVTAFTALGLITTATQPAQAQLNWTIVGVGEFDTEDVVLVLGGLSVSRGGEGWSPSAGVTVSWLQYPTASVADETREIISVVPSIGFRNGFNGGSIGFRVGYAFRDASDDDPLFDDPVPPVAADVGDDGIVNSAQIDYWGDGRLGAQAIASYNYGSESLWARGRLTYPVFGLSDGGQVRLGGEAAYLTGEGYDAWQVGGVVGFNPGRGVIINGGIGRKLAFDDGKDATYFRAELVLMPGR
jgi:hypothetical protein